MRLQAGRRRGQGRLVRRRCRRGGARLAALALLGPLALPGAAIGSQQLHLPSAASVRSVVVHLADFLTGHHALPPVTPAQRAGSAAGKAHEVPAAVTRAVANATGRDPGKARGQSPMYRSLRGAVKRFTTGPAPGTGGYDPKTSAVDTAGSTATSILYKNADGSYSRQVFAAPVNYKTGSGKWTRIDTSLVAGSGGRWKAKAAPVSVSLARKADDAALASVAGKGKSGSAFSVSLGLAGAAGVTGTKNQSTARYAGILPSTNLTMTDTAAGVSADLVLASASAPSSWVFPLRLDGLTARAVPGGSVDLVDGSGKVAAVIPEGLARDSAAGPAGAGPGNGATVAVPWTVARWHGGTALEGSVPASWLDAPSRVFPVTVDPSVNADTSGSTYVMNPFTNDYSGEAFLKVGYDGASSGGSNEYARSFLKFKGLGSALKDEHVTAATLHLWDAWAWTCTTPEQFQVNEITSTWDLTGDKSWPGPSIGTQMGSSDVDAPSSACTNTSGSTTVGGWMKVSMTSTGLGVLNDWTLNPSDDHGLAVCASMTDEYRWKQFDSFNTTHVPYLWISYSPDVQPQVNEQYPPDNYSASSLAPQLIASGSDPDNWPDPLEYVFTVYSEGGSKIASSGLVSSMDWTVPKGDLSWGSTYYWTVQDYDGLDYSAAPSVSYFSTPVPQPLVTSGLSLNSSGRGYDPATGNWTTQATDAKVPTVGPALEVTRDYNSFDPRQGGAFGAGWSSVLDMEVQPGAEGASGAAGTEVVTYPDGQQVAYGLNSDGSYAQPPGRYAQLRSVSGGFTLTDKNDTVYTFTHSLGSGAYGITSIADAFGHTEKFAYNSSGEITMMTSASGRELGIVWATPSGASHAHVSQVHTQDVTAGDSSSVEVWSYGYSGDKLTSVCPPSSPTACTKYSYTAGSDYPESVLDSGPQSYWRLDEASGTSAKSSVLANEGTDDATYSNVQLASTAGPLAGSTVKSPHFNGSSSYVTLPDSLVDGAAYMTVSLWFKTTSTGQGVLFSYQKDPVTGSTTTGGYTPAIYLGTDHKLHAQFWDDALAPMVTPGTVNDGKWHLVTMTAAGDTQALYLDGVQVASKSGTITVTGQQYDYLGAGFLGGNWPDESHENQNGNEGYATYFSGDLSDAAIWDRPLAGSEVTALYKAGTQTAALATKVTRPSGKTYETVGYDSLTGRATSVTDSAGGTWLVGAPSVIGSSQVYRSAVLGAGPADYWRLNGTGVTDAINQVEGGTAVDSNVTEGVPGPFSDVPAYEFNGTSSYVALPSGLVRSNDESVSLWFKTSTPDGVILSSSASPITDATTSGNYTSEIYVGSSGKLHAEFRDSQGPMASPAAVDDGKWHNVVLSASATGERLYLDGTLLATVSATVSLGSGQDYDYLGAGFLGGNWPDEPHGSASSGTGYRTYFTGDIAEVAFFRNEVGNNRATDMWKAAKRSGGMMPVEYVDVTDPGGKTIKYAYDPLHGDRVLFRTDALGHRTSYGYDIHGFLGMTVNPDGDETWTGHDVRGNLVSKTTCQDQAANECSTSYYTYYPNDTSSQPAPDPRNDVLMTSRDPRSSSASDPTYETEYTYNSVGELTAKTTPPVAGFPSGRTTTYAYTSGTTSTGGYDGVVPPKGLPWKVTTPGGAVTKTLYDAAGDVAQVTDPDGLVTRYSYDGIGEVISKTVISDSFPNGLTTTYAYDEDGQVVKETDPPVTNRVTGAVHTAQITTTYDADGDVTKQTVADTTGGDASRTVTRNWNSHDELASETDAAGNTTTYTYNAYGKKATKTGPDGNVTSYAYDADGRLLTTTLENYTGSPSGSQAAANLVEESRAYDPAGRLASVTDAMGRVIKYGYTDNGLLATVTAESPDGSKTFTVKSDTYDAAGNVVKKVTNNGFTTTDYTVDAAGRVTKKVLDPSGLDRVTSISYTPDGNESTVTQSGPSGATQVTSYTYDPGGNMTSKSLYSDGSGHPTGWWRLNQASGSTVTDSSGTGNTARAAGVTWSGGAASFAGSSGQGIATNGPVLNTTASFSVSAWVELPTEPTANEAVVAQAGTSVAAFWLLYSASKGEWAFDVHAGDSTSATVYPVYGSPPTGTSLTGTWTHLVGVYDSGTSSETLYVDGVKTATASGVSAFSATGPLQIGEGLYGGSEGSYLNGSVDNVQVYPRVLSASEVSALYKAGRSGGTTASSTELTTKWTLDQRGLPTSVTGPDGNVTDYAYDAAGRLAVTTEPAVPVETYGNAIVTASPVTMAGYDTFGDKAEAEDADGNVTTYGYDADGREVSKTLPSYTPPGSSTAITATSARTYDGLGQLTSSTDALGNTTTYAYDQLGDLTSVTAPDGSVTSCAYDADKEQLSQTSPTGAVTEATYDFMGRTATSTQVEQHNSTGSAQAYTTSFSYGTGGWLSKSVTPDGAVTERGYDAAGELTSVTNAAGDVTSYNYDDLGRQTTVTYPDDTSKVTGYDAAGNVTSVQNLNASGATLTTTSATYDGNGDELSSTDARGDTTTFTYDATGMLTQEVQPVSSSESVTVSFGYDAAGNQTRYTDGDGNNWYYTYNPWGLRQSRIEPATSQYTSAADSTFTTGYNADGEPVTEAEPGGATITEAYNSVGELTGESGSGAGAATASRSFGYNASGELTSAATSNTAPSSSASNATSESFAYNDRGQVLTASGTAGSTSYTYNGDGLVTSVADAAGTTSYTYDSADRLNTLTDPATGTTATYSYNSDSLVTGISYGGDTRTLAYDSLHRLTSDTLKASSGSTVASASYGYNANGEVTTKETTGLAGASSSSYTYDEAGRLTSWDNGTTTVGYGYDANGNLTQKGSKTYAYDARDELTSDGTNTYSYTARGTLASEATPSGTVSSSFDAYGDQVGAGTQSYGYDALGRVIADAPASASSSGPSWQFSYAGKSGALASDGSSTYTWGPAGRVLAGVGSAGGTGGGVLAFTDSHGDVVGEFTASGTSLAGSAGYGPWGVVTATSGTLAGQLGFQSGWTDPVTSTVAMGARWYDPSAGGFTSADTVQVPAVPDPAAGNPFAYVGDEPLTGMDPTGHCWSWASSVCSVVHTVAHGVDVGRHAVAHGFDVGRHAVAAAVDHSFASLASYTVGLYRVAQGMAAWTWRATQNLAHRVRDAAVQGARVVTSAARDTWGHAVGTYQQVAGAVTRYAVRGFHRVEHVVSTTWHHVTGYVHRAAGKVVRLSHAVAVAAGRGLRKAAVVTGRFIARHAAAIGGAAAGVAVFAGCEAVTLGAGSVGCAAAAGAAAGAVSYGIRSAQSGSFSVGGLAEATAEGALAGAVTGGIAEAVGGAAGSVMAGDGAGAAGNTAAAETAGSAGTAPEAAASRAAAGFEADSSGAVSDVRGLGRTDNQVVLSGHGYLKPGAGEVTVPEGTCIAMYCAHGETISDFVGNQIETGAPGQTPVEVFGPGESLPNYTLHPPDGLRVAGNPITVSQPTPLSELLRPNMGTCNWAACREVLP